MRGTYLGAQIGGVVSPDGTDGARAADCRRVADAIDLSPRDGGERGTEAGHPTREEVCPGIGLGGPCVAAAAPGPNSRGKDPREAWQGREATEGPHPKEQCLPGGRETVTVIGLQPRLERDALGPIRTLESNIEPAAPRLLWGPIKRSPEGGLGPQKFRFERGPLNKTGESVRPK
ncbi:hypothetical protein NDU88_010766 [Pleurodeles waltl]|uniref:Uncharacterized protein n=1 Tax=Pleurodeles waltl TaxID=8319 RepID=A0AAV7RZY3_PLEWA|nr:hypothetical protein NDU88_010766 [Pleurodeles waltl]